MDPHTHAHLRCLDLFHRKRTLTPKPSIALETKDVMMEPSDTCVGFQWADGGLAPVHEVLLKGHGPSTRGPGTGWARMWPQQGSVPAEPLQVSGVKGILPSISCRPAYLGLPPRRRPEPSRAPSPGGPPVPSLQSSEPSPRSQNLPLCLHLPKPKAPPNLEKSKKSGQQLPFPVTGNPFLIGKLHTTSDILAFLEPRTSLFQRLETSTGTTSAALRRPGGVVRGGTLPAI